MHPSVYDVIFVSPAVYSLAAFASQSIAPLLQLARQASGSMSLLAVCRWPSFAPSLR
ncbi:hypothetical protein [Numidum massiliense]|uniref:hypothetical protein n=1 Tax=Numidum massiliense TaxID=1522315 RepID=UPI00164DC707|nr:hypothetical protein [Numidum massiliense]